MLSVRPTTRKTYGRTASGKQITDDLVDALAERAEAGYEIEDPADPSGRLRRLAKQADGLDRDALEHIEELPGDEHGRRQL